MRAGILGITVVAIGLIWSVAVMTSSGWRVSAIASANIDDARTASTLKMLFIRRRLPKP
jgi:ABC-type transport system involved in cytochrome bd biosynthesis fused ATPase/permease subunit